MIVLGIDPGIGITGTAVIEENKGKLTLLTSQGITTSTNLPVPQRLAVIYQEVLHLLAGVKPDVAALETLFFHTNVTTAFSVGQARGVVILALAQAKIPIVEYNPVSVKMALTSFGGAKKGQVQRMVAKILRLPKTLTPDDVADAAAIALTYCFSYKLNEETKRAKCKDQNLV